MTSLFAFLAFKHSDCITLLLTCFIFISKLFHAHMFYLPQLDCKIFEFRWCVTFYFTPIFIAVGNLGILYLPVITNRFCFTGHWQVKFCLTQMHSCSNRKWTELNKNEILSNTCLAMDRATLPIDTLVSCFLLSPEGQVNMISKDLESFSMSVLSPFSFPLSSLFASFEKNHRGWPENRIWKYSNLM